jgi:hypothetical protein
VMHTDQMTVGTDRYDRKAKNETGCRYSFSRCTAGER